MEKVLIIQNGILHYRISICNGVSKYHDLHILHSGYKYVGIDDR